MGQESGQTIAESSFQGLTGCSEVVTWIVLPCGSWCPLLHFLAAGELRPSATWEVPIVTASFRPAGERICCFESLLSGKAWQVLIRSEPPGIFSLQSQLNSLIASSKFFHLCHILLVRSKLQVLPHKGIDKVWGGISGTIFEVCLHELHSTSLDTYLSISKNFPILSF